MAAYHVPVMLSEVSGYLVNNTNGIYVDATLGGGGHSGYLLEHFADIRLIGIDCDSDAVREAEGKLVQFKGRMMIANDNFSNIGTVLKNFGISQVDGVLMDLGVSSKQLENSSRGFGFSSNTLDMRMDNALEKNASDIVNNMREDELADVIFKYGEERQSRKIASIICNFRKTRKITSSAQLSELLQKNLSRHGKINPATKTFQAIRIFVNDELNRLDSVMSMLPEIMCHGGRAVVISYHSLEDRIVKNAFKKYALNGDFKPIEKKVVIPSRTEVMKNPRARSAKLRVAERV